MKQIKRVRNKCYAKTGSMCTDTLHVFYIYLWNNPHLFALYGGIAERRIDNILDTMVG